MKGVLLACSQCRFWVVNQVLSIAWSDADGGGCAPEQESRTSLLVLEVPLVSVSETRVQADAYGPTEGKGRSLLQAEQDFEIPL